MPCNQNGLCLWRKLGCGSHLQSSTRCMMTNLRALKSLVNDQSWILVKRILHCLRYVNFTAEIYCLLPPEEEPLAGRPVPPECHAELHTDYDGSAVRWGLTHHKESAADCCQACLDQSKRAKPGEMKCNIWVYCPLEAGCYSPDIYEHKHQECWLKYVSLNS